MTILQADPLPFSNNGDFKDPQTGIIEHNATLSAVYEALVALDQQALFDHTLSSLQRTIANLWATLQAKLCRDCDKTLLPRYLEPVTSQIITVRTLYLVSMIATLGIAMAVDAASYAYVGPFKHYNALG